MKMGGSGGNAPAPDVAIQQHYQPHDLQLHHPVPAAAAPDVAIQQHYQPHDLQLHHPVPAAAVPHDVATQQHYQPHDLQLHHPVPAAAAPDVAIQQHYQPHDLQLHHPVPAAAVPHDVATQQHHYNSPQIHHLQPHHHPQYHSPPYHHPPHSHYTPGHFYDEHHRPHVLVAQGQLPYEGYGQVQPQPSIPYDAPILNQNPSPEDSHQVEAVEEEPNPAEKAKELNKNYGHLLINYEGDPRGRFLVAPTELLGLLRDVWSLGTEKHGDDKISKRMRGVQQYTPQIQMRMFDGEGLLAHDEFTPWGKKRVAEIVATFKKTLAQALVDMEYAEDDSFAEGIQIHLSLLKTTFEKVQEPHLDFKWDVVTPSPDEEQGSTEQKGTPQGNVKTRGKGRKKAPFRERVPFAVFVPLTEDGMTLELWRHRKDHKKNRHQLGEVVNVPYGTFLMMRGDTVHAGGFLTSAQGNPRAHFYMYQGRDQTIHPYLPKNEYQLPPYYNSEDRLATYYRHSQHVHYKSPKKVRGALLLK